MFSVKKEKANRLQPFYFIDLFVLTAAVIVWVLMFIHVLPREVLPLVIGLISLSFFIRSFEQSKMKNKSASIANLIAACIVVLIMLGFIIF
ncbi:hypothetical protein LGQ02_15330 [Bacillus shivajii]|uniref:hypothetical protein n=1 Tax=Bacillus shivajii TaxID=1983719 RepID=UPI001CF9CC53|nr:hypothetical protein [Bacillus shivajii]UCZ52206.1 hypothetical protein LGQ02_15330 [Bacillus shivajii]